LLISDVVSDITEPTLDSLTKDKDLEEFLEKIVKERKFFHGTSYRQALESLKKHPQLENRFESFELKGVWKWEWPNRTYLVWMVSADLMISDANVISKGRKIRTITLTNKEEEEEKKKAKQKIVEKQKSKEEL